MSTRSEYDAELRELDEALPTEPDEARHHGGSDALYIQIFFILFALTAAEVSTYFFDVGASEVPVLITLMVVKFALVVMFFMHLRFDHKLFSWVFVSGLVLAVIVYMIMLTTFSYWESL
jgi:cytochrome c oxidase subunit 4